MSGMISFELKEKENASPHFYKCNYTTSQLLPYEIM